MNAIGVILILLILVTAFLWMKQLRKLTLGIERRQKVIQKEENPEKVAFRQQIAKCWAVGFKNAMAAGGLAGMMERAKPTEQAGNSPARTNNEKDEEDNDDLDKDKDFAPQLNNGEDEEEEEEEEEEDLEEDLGGVGEIKRKKESQPSLDQLTKSYNKTRAEDEKVSKYKMLFKLFKCLYIIELCNCHTLYQVSRGDYAFPQDMYNRTVVFQQLILYLVASITFILTIKGVHYNASVSDDFLAFVITTLVLSTLFITMAYVLRAVHTYHKQQKAVRA